MPLSPSTAAAATAGGTPSRLARSSVAASSWASPAGLELMQRAMRERYDALLQKMYCLRSALFAIHSQVADDPAAWVATVQNSLALVFPQCAVYLTLPPAPTGGAPVGNNAFTPRMVRLVERTRSCKQLVVDNADEDADTGEVVEGDGGHCLCAPIKDADDAACGAVLLCSADAPFEMDDEEFMLLLSDQINLSFQWLRRDQEHQRVLRAGDAAAASHGDSLRRSVLGISSTTGASHATTASSATNERVPFIGTPLLRRSRTTPTTRDTSSSSRRCISNVRANTTYNSHLSHLLHSSAAGQPTASLRRSTRGAGEAAASVAAASVVAAAAATASLRASGQATAAVARATPSGRAGRGVQSAPLGTDSSGLGAAATVARARVAMATAASAVRGGRASELTGGGGGADAAGEAGPSSQRGSWSPDLRLSDFLQSPVAGLLPPAAADRAASVRGVRDRSAGGSAAGANCARTPAAGGSRLGGGDRGGEENERPPLTQQRRQPQEQSQHERQGRPGSSGVAKAAGALTGPTPPCASCVTLRRRLKLHEQQWRNERAALGRGTPTGRRIGNAAAGSASHSNASHGRKLGRGGGGGGSGEGSSAGAGGTDSGSDGDGDLDDDGEAADHRADSKLLAAVEACLLFGGGTDGGGEGAGLDGAGDGGAAAAAAAAEDQLLAFRRFLAAVRAWSAKLGFPTVRIYRVLGCEEDANSGQLLGGDASYYEVTSQPEGGLARGLPRRGFAGGVANDAHAQRPVRWDGLVGDAINILRQSGQQQLRYQRHMFFPIRAARSNGGRAGVRVDDGPLRAVVRVEDGSLLGHAIHRRRRLFQRWLRFIRHHAGNLLLLLLEGAGGGRSRSQPLVATSATARDNQDQQQHHGSGGGASGADLAVQAPARVRAHKRVFEFVKAVLQLTPRLAPAGPSSSDAGGGAVASAGRNRTLRRLSQHVRDLAAHLGVTSAAGTATATASSGAGAAPAVRVVVWWAEDAFSPAALSATVASLLAPGVSGRLLTFDAHAAFAQAADGGAAGGSGGEDPHATALMSAHDAQRFRRAYAAATAEWAEDLAKGSSRIQKAFRGKPCFAYGAATQTVGHFVGGHRVGSPLAGIVEVVFSERHWNNNGAAARAVWWPNALHFLTYVSGVLSAWHHAAFVAGRGR